MEKNKKLLKANDSPIGVYNKIIVELKEVQDNNLSDLEKALVKIKEKNRRASLDKVDNRKFLLHLIETDKGTIDFFVEIFSKEKINYKKIKIIKDDINIFLNTEIKYLIFNSSCSIPGPIKIIDNILILPGKIPACLYHEKRVISIYQEIEKRYLPRKKKKKRS